MHRCLVILAGGGWYEETRRILARMTSQRFEFIYAYAFHGRDHSAALLPLPRPGKVDALRYLGYTRPRPMDRLRHVGRMLLALVDAARIIHRHRPHSVLAVGCASAVPMFFLARLLRTRCVFVESVTRSRELSLTGRIIRVLKLGKVYVQWPGLSERLSGCHYAGSVL